MADESESPLLDAARLLATEMRGGYRMSRGWHVVLPHWVLRGRAWEQFCGEFEASYARRPELAWAGVIGFEIGWGLTCRRYTLKRYRDEQEITE